VRAPARRVSVFLREGDSFKGEGGFAGVRFSGQAYLYYRIIRCVFGYDFGGYRYEDSNDKY
jgi:hypothetical protein